MSRSEIYKYRKSSEYTGADETTGSSKRFSSMYTPMQGLILHSGLSFHWPFGRSAPLFVTVELDLHMMDERSSSVSSRFTAASTCLQSEWPLFDTVLDDTLSSRGIILS